MLVRSGLDLRKEVLPQLEAERKTGPPVKKKKEHGWEIPGRHEANPILLSSLLFPLMVKFRGPFFGLKIILILCF